MATSEARISYTDLLDSYNDIIQRPWEKINLRYYK